jgi:hypothetical protein
LKFDQEMYYYILYFRTKPISTVSIIIQMFVVSNHGLMYQDRYL